MARTDVYLNINAASPASAVVAGLTDTTSADFPELVLGDAPEFNFYFTDGTSAPSWAGDVSYTVTWSLGWAQNGDTQPLAITTTATPVSGGWSVRLPVNTGRLMNEVGAVNVSQDYPVVRLWQQIRVADSDGNPVTYAFLRTRLRLTATASTQSTPSDDPTPSGTQNVLATAGGALASPTNFFTQLTSFTASSNASGNTTATPGTYAAFHFEEVTISGAGSTTRVLVLPTTGRSAGQRLAVRFLCPATAGITLEVRNATSGGTLLLSAQTDGSGDDVAAEFYFNGTDWKSFEAQFAS